MYPYKEYNAEFGEVVYNHDGSVENEIAITVDKMVHNELLNNDIRLYDIIEKHYHKSTINCDDDITTIINNWLMHSEYRHIHTLLDVYIPIRDSYLYY